MEKGRALPKRSRRRLRRPPGEPGRRSPRGRKQRRRRDLQAGLQGQAEYESAKKGQGWAELQALLGDAARVANVEFGAYDAGVCGIDNPDAKNCVHAC